MSIVNLYNREEVEKELNTLSNYACAKGFPIMNQLAETSDNDIEFDNKVSEYGEVILVTIHEGFRKAQDGIIAVLLQLQDEEELIRSQLKRAKEKKERQRIPDLKNKLDYLAFISQLFHHCADSIAWQLIGGQLHIARRLYLGIDGKKRLKETNYQSVKKVADHINSNPKNFVLLTDITTNIQIGDLIGVVDGGFTVLEVKEGATNAEAVKIMFQEKSGKAEENPRYKINPKLQEQIARIRKQEVRLAKLSNILKDDEGDDLVSDNYIKIITPQETTPFFNEELQSLEQRLTLSTWAYDIVDMCLHIGFYKGPKRQLGRLILKGLAAEQDKKNCIIFDARNAIGSLTAPVYSWPLSQATIFDIFFGRTIVLFMLDLDAFIELYSWFGHSARWATRKETAMYRDNFKDYKIFVHDNRGIIVSSEVESSSAGWLTPGTISKIVFDHIYPHYMAYSTQYSS